MGEAMERAIANDRSNTIVIPALENVMDMLLCSKTMRIETRPASAITIQLRWLPSYNQR